MDTFDTLRGDVFFDILNDEKIEEEVITMTKTLYDPEVEKKGIEKGIKEAILDLLSDIGTIDNTLIKK